jgi:hypothetical protein
MHSHPQLSMEPFGKWGIEFIVPIDPLWGHKKHIRAYIDYLAKWTEVKDIKDAIEQNVAAFLQECILSRFVYPIKIVTGQGTQFTSKLIEF